MFHQLALIPEYRPPQFSVEGFRSEPEVYVILEIYGWGLLLSLLVPSMYDRSMQITTKQSTLWQRRLVLKKSCYTGRPSLWPLWNRLKWQSRWGNSQPNLEIKLVFTFEIVYLRNLKCLRTYQQPIEQQNLIWRRKIPITKTLGGSVDCSRRQVFVFFFLATNRGILCKKKKKWNVLKKLLFIIRSDSWRLILCEQNCWCKRVVEALGWD